jgi:hypothetical protein
MGTYLDAKTFVVSWIALCEGKLHTQKVEALHSWHAMQESNQDVLLAKEFHTCTTMQDLQKAAHKRNGFIAVIEVK